MNENRIVTAAAAGAVAFAGTRFGVLKQIPGLGPVPAAGVTILIGVVLAAYIEKGGLSGAIIEGAGYGLVTVGALELASA